MLTKVILILAPLFVGGSIVASRRLRSLVYGGGNTIAFRRPPGWDTAFIVIGGLFVFKATLDAAYLGRLAQVCGFALCIEFFWVAWLNAGVVLSSAGIMVGMRYAPWRSFVRYDWTSQRTLELVTRSNRRTRIRVPDRRRDDVADLVDRHVYGTS